MEKSNSNQKENNWPLIGNTHITSFLEKSVANNKVGSAYIFLGPDNLGKTTTAVYFAKSLLCQRGEAGKFNLPCGICPSCTAIRKEKNEDTSTNLALDGENYLKNSHGDFHIVKKEKGKKNISVDQIRDFIKMLSMSSFLGSYKIGIIKNAERLSTEAANSLLKTLEEPREKVIIILTVSFLETIPKTIASRSQVLNFYPVSSSDIYDYLVESDGCPRAFAKNISRLSLGRPALAQKFLEDKDFYEEYLFLSDSFLNFFNNDINGRFLEVEKIMGNKDTGEDNVKKALVVLGVWQGLVRDLLLICANKSDLVQHEIVLEKLNEVSRKIHKSKLIELNKMFEESGNYIRANVNPKLVLENIALSI